MSLSKRLFNFIYFQSWNLGLWRTPDRKFLQDELLPSLLRPNAPALFVGVRRYTRDYGAGHDFVTIDMDPRMRRFGAPVHFTMNVKDLEPLGAHYPGGFSSVFLNGVIGYGLDDREGCSRALSEIHRRLQSGGWLVVGAAPTTLAELKFSDLVARQGLFRESSCPRELATHYDFGLPGYRGVRHRFLFFKSIPLSP